MDEARNDHDEDAAPPPMAAAFMLGSIRCMVTGAILRGAPEDFATEVRGLYRLVLSAFPGQEAAVALTDSSSPASPLIESRRAQEARRPREVGRGYLPGFARVAPGIEASGVVSRGCRQWTRGNPSGSCPSGVRPV